MASACQQCRRPLAAVPIVVFYSYVKASSRREEEVLQQYRKDFSTIFFFFCATVMLQWWDPTVFVFVVVVLYYTIPFSFYSFSLVPSFSFAAERKRKKRRPLSISWNLRWMFKEIFRAFCFFSFIWNKRGTKKENKLQTDPTEWHHCFVGQRTMKGVIYSNGIQNYNKKKKIENRNNFEYYLVFNIRRSQDFKRNEPT